jgi:hypothetical protein
VRLRNENKVIVTFSEHIYRNTGINRDQAKDIMRCVHFKTLLNRRLGKTLYCCHKKFASKILVVTKFLGLHTNHVKFECYDTMRERWVESTIEEME